MTKQATVDACISAIYEGVTSDEAWFGMLKLLADSSASKSGFFCLERNDRNQILSYMDMGFDAKTLTSYAGYFVGKDIWTKRLYNRTPGYFHASHLAVNQKDFYRTEIFNDWCNMQDMHHATGIFITNVGDASLRLSLQRDKSAGEYTQRDLRKLNLFAPHLKRAIALRNTFSTTSFLKHSVSSIVDSLPFAAFLLESTDRILYFNAAAEALFARSEGFVNAMGTLRLHPGWTQPFFKSVHACLNFLDSEPARPNFVHLLRTAAPRASFEVSIAPMIVNDIQLCTGYARRLVLVIVKEETRKKPADAALLAQLFGLTPKEAQVTAALCQGKDIKQIADDSHVSILTVRTQLRAILRKTDTRTQQQMIARVLTGITTLVGSRDH
jgi:DNA-binding CsgD family transcriptional regulator/PAS domain-containing protein